MKLFSYDSPVVQFLSKVFDVMLIGILWLVGCLPIITIGASTTAMYKALFNLLREDTSSVALAFLKSFKQNFKQATFIWLIALGATVFVLTDIAILWVYGKHWIWISVFVILLLLLVAVFVMLIYVFPLQACFCNKVMETLKNSLVFAVGYLPRTFLMLVLDITILIGLLACAPPLLLFSGVLTALANVAVLNKVFIKHEEVPE